MIHRGLSRGEARIAAQDVLVEMQIPDPERIMASYPHQLSGGQQQRAVIAMALLPQPRLLLLDEPTTALDVTVEAGIVDLLGALRRTRGTAMLFISHNLGLVACIRDRAVAMQAGEIAETGEVRSDLRAASASLHGGLVAPHPAPRSAGKRWKVVGADPLGRCNRTGKVTSVAVSARAASTIGASCAIRRRSR